MTFIPPIEGHSENMGKLPKSTDFGSFFLIFMTNLVEGCLSDYFLANSSSIAVVSDFGRSMG